MSSSLERADVLSTSYFELFDALSHHQCGPAAEPTTLKCGRNKLRPANTVRGTDSTGVQLLRLEARRISIECSLCL